MTQSWWHALTYFELVTAMAAAVAALVVFFLRGGVWALVEGGTRSDDQRFRHHLSWLIFRGRLPACPTGTTNYDLLHLCLG